MFRIRVSEHSKENGWTMKAVADMMEVEYQTVLYWNRGKASPRIESLVRLAQLFGCSIDHLVDA